MSIGKIAVDAIKWWDPFSPEAYARRDRNKAYRKARRKKKRNETLTEEEQAIMAQEVIEIKLPDGRVIERMEPIIKLRSSTKMLTVGGGVLAATAAAVIPNWDAINAAMAAACESEQGPAIGLGMMAGMLVVNYVTTRKVKSPIDPGKV